MKAFTPRQEATVSINASGTSANVQIGGVNISFNVRVFNAGSQTAFVNFGADNTVTATSANSMPVAPGAIEVFAVNSGGWAAAIGSGLIYFTPGDGL